ncbi:hypothetical protein [Pseudooceanicola algae]|uniref:Bacterial OB-fold domain-containing protein n=1 Tax=Pseudooceanicola algae TaxID=1537215 RepID=A0A418SFL1_9RHOB|nr:hypothetical protein [Pseudooceanicola algae]QPM89880.1 hypothetical protein PSAL_011090 [Pseudooceanicola algae]
MLISRQGLLALLPAMSASPALAHHGWRWTEDEEFELTGIITEAPEGPGGILWLNVEGQIWQARIGPLLHDADSLPNAEMLVPGTEITLRGQFDPAPNRQGIKVRKVLLNGRSYVLRGEPA